MASIRQLALFGIVSLAYADSDMKACNLWQVCQNNEATTTPGTLPTTPCADPHLVSIPVFVEGGFDPSPMSEGGKDAFAVSCPFYEEGTPVCCNADTAQIMQVNYSQLDGVFATDCPICAANLKRMWCEYACNPDKSSFLVQKGSTPTEGIDYTNVQASIADDYACTVYQSCKGTSFIAAAGVSSSVAFLNFLGYNGAPYSLSYINFTTDWEGQTSGYLNSSALPCDGDVDPDGILYGYTDIKNSTCSYCSGSCSPPLVNDDIGFLDGFSWKLVGYSYLGFILFTIAFQVLMQCYIKKRKLAAVQAAQVSAQTGSTAMETSRQTDQDNSGHRYTQQGRPMNVTMSDADSNDNNRRTGNSSLGM